MRSKGPPAHIYDAQDQHIMLGEKIGTGKQGTVYAIQDQARLAAKVFHQPPQQDTDRKLAAMLVNQPPVTSCSAFIIAWPQQLIRTPKRQGRTIGYTMTLVPHQQFHEVGAYFNPTRRRRLLQNRQQGYTYLHLLAIASNIAQAVAHLHAQGHLIGDLNSRNVLVSDRAQAALIDTDSYQIKDPRDATVHPCSFGTPEYMPPNLQGVQLAEAKRTQRDDLFSLAVMVYQLLFQGQHPFTGVRNTASAQHKRAEG